jgi:hypothetical protein
MLLWFPFLGFQSFGSLPHYLVCSRNVFDAIGLASESESEEEEEDGEDQFEDDLEFLRSLDPKVRDFTLL